MEESKKELTIERTFDAPRDLVFNAWTDPKLVAQWWGPRGVTNPTCAWEARPGGSIHIVMLAGEQLGSMAGQEWPMKGEFKEVDEPKKLVFTAKALRDDKAILENLVTVTFEEHDRKTKIVTHILVTKTTPETEGPLKGMEMGWNQQLDKLGEFLQRPKK